jgi:murein DD-endopeptidase MepM/ murein hydrolase activator NlpD
MGGLIILTIAAGATAAIILARKQAVADAFFAAGGRLPTPSKSPRQRQRFWQPVQETGRGGRAAAVVDQGRRSRGWNMNRVTADGRRVPHWGVDITARRGTPVRAAMDGVVRRTGAMSGYGNIVIIEHPGGKVTLYGHLDQADVRVGDAVEGGQVIATVGRTTAGPNGVVPTWGRTMGAHLHMEVHASNPPDLRGGAQSAQRRGVIEPEGWLRSQGIALYAKYA